VNGVIPAVIVVVLVRFVPFGVIPIETTSV
jgi:hypothetical protein